MTMKPLHCKIIIVINITEYPFLDWHLTPLKPLMFVHLNRFKGKRKLYTVKKTCRFNRGNLSTILPVFP